MNQKPHHERAHSVWSASATARNWQCPGAIALSTIAPDEKPSIYADRGTAAHEVAERALRNDKECVEYLGQTITTSAHEVEVDEEIVNGAQTYVDYIRALPAGGNLKLEQRYDLESLQPPFEAGGTCDAIYILPSAHSIEVIDYKHGTSPVEANENKQLRTYSLMALLNADALGIETVKTTIVQPRAWHTDGRIRSETFHVADLMQWGSDLLKAMNRSKAALDAFNALGGSQTAFAEWAAEWLRHGNCIFCPCAGMCPAVRKQVLAVTPTISIEWFEDPTLETPPALANTPKPQSVEELGHILDGLDALENWINSVRTYAHQLAEGGASIPGWKLAQKVGNRAWLDEVSTAETLKLMGLGDSQIYTRKIVSPAQADKLLGKRKDALTPLWEKPIRGTNLVQSDRSERTSVTPLVEKYLDKL